MFFSLEGDFSMLGGKGKLVTVHTRVPSNGILPMLRIPNRQNLLPELYRTEFSVQKILTCEQLRKLQLLFTHACPVTEFAVASHSNTANSCCHHVFLRHFRFQKCLPVNSNKLHANLMLNRTNVCKGFWNVLY